MVILPYYFYVHGQRRE